MSLFERLHVKGCAGVEGDIVELISPLALSKTLHVTYSNQVSHLPSSRFVNRAMSLDHGWPCNVLCAWILFIYHSGFNFNAGQRMAEEQRSGRENVFWCFTVHIQCFGLYFLFTISNVNAEN
ncbi:unnamed protein product [Arctogadus glacialis]